MNALRTTGRPLAVVSLVSLVTGCAALDTATSKVTGRSSSLAGGSVSSSGVPRSTSDVGRRVSQGDNVQPVSGPVHGTVPGSVTKALAQDREITAEHRVAAAPGRQTVAPMAPTWCPDENARGSTAYPARDDFMFNDREGVALPAHAIVAELREGAEGWSEPRREIVHRLAWSSCVLPKDQRRQQWIAIGRQILVNNYGMSEEDQRTQMAAALFTEAHLEHVRGDACAALEAQTSTDDTALVKRDVTQYNIRCHDAFWKRPQNPQAVRRMKSSEHWARTLRQPELPSELAKLAFVSRCLEVQIGSPPARHTVADPAIAAASTYCGNDARTLNRARIKSELTAEKLPPALLASALEMTSYTLLIVDATLASVDAASKRAPWMADVLVKRPEAARAEWLRNYKGNKASIDLAHAYELKFEANSSSKSELQKVFAGCGKPLHENFARYVRSKKPRDIDQFMAAATDSVGHTLLTAVAACDAIEGRIAAASGARAQLLARAYPAHGPRAAAYLAASSQLAVLAGDRNDLPWSASQFTTSVHSTAAWAAAAYDRMGWGKWPVMGSFSNDRRQSDRGAQPYEADGDIQSITRKDGGYEVTFKQVRYRAAMEECKATNKLVRVEWSGASLNPIYATNCRITGYQTFVSQIAPIRIPEVMGAGLQPGMSLRVYTHVHPAEKGRTREGFALEAYSDRSRKKLVHIFGVAL